MKTISGLYLICFFCLAGLSACGNSRDTSEEAADIQSIIIDVTGDAYNWYFRYPGKDGALGNADDQYSVQNLFLPDNTDVTLRLHSKDYVYSFSLPDWGVSEVAVPGLEFELNFSTGAELSLIHI